MSTPQKDALAEIKTLKQATIDAILALHKQADALSAAGEKKTAKATRSKATALGKQATILRDLEVQIYGALPIQTTIDRLNAATADARQAVADLNEVADALKTAEKLLKILRDITLILG